MNHPVSRFAITAALTLCALSCEEKVEEPPVYLPDLPGAVIAEDVVDGGQGPGHIPSIPPVTALEGLSGVGVREGEGPVRAE